MFFRNEFYFLSNMYPCNIELNIKGKVYKFTCAESAFQACKDVSNIERFIGLNGFEAKKLGRTQNLVRGWGSIESWNKNRIKVMKHILIKKFTQNPNLMEMLKSIDVEIIEENCWNDRFWGVCNGIGSNNLGKLLNEIKNN